MTIAPTANAPALDGMRDAARRLDVAAHNVANASTQPFAPLRPDGTTDATDSLDMPTEMVAVATAPIVYTANAQVVRANDRMVGSRVPSTRWSSWPGRRSARAVAVSEWRSDHAKTSTAAPSDASWTATFAAGEGRSSARRSAAVPARFAAMSGAMRCEPQRSCSFVASRASSASCS